ncbi:MAG: YfcE family phosphodiesterase [Ruminococcaceae bacterium]|nr:YfcE family phosphodiesterase [Oscillospiraceae bacterium]
MKILVLSDSHAGLSFMRRAISAVKPDAVVHLGDYYEDAMAMEEENPHIRFHMVPGNCDRNRMLRYAPEMLCYDVCGVRLYMTHGHKHQVKLTQHRLLADARGMGAAAALYGHTHSPYCQQEADGLWVLNPGSCGSSGGSVGLIETDGSTILGCRILRQTDLEE